MINALTMLAQLAGTLEAANTQAPTVIQPASSQRREHFLLLEYVRRTLHQAEKTWREGGEVG
jgi:hypothetical protein